MTGTDPKKFEVDRLKNAMRLNRRNFIGGMVAAATSPRLSAGQAAPSQFPSSTQGKWMNKGLVDAGGSHEPYIFVVRRGGQRLDARQISDYQQSETLIRELHDQGVEVFHTHLYKGFGMEAEQEGMEQTRKAVAFAHSLGMKADTYIQWNSLMYESFFAEESEAADWVQRNVSGLPILLPYSYQQSFRYRPCFTNQNYLNYLKKIVRYAVVDVKTDFIHFDNFDLNAEPDSCHCPACVSGFRERLKTKYTLAQRKERFGFSRVDFINPPQWNEDNPPAQMQIISDPAFQEWIDFRCQLMSDALKQMYDLVHSLNPEVALEINPGGITGQNHPWMAGTDHARLLKFTRSFWSEEGNDPAMLKDGRLISRIRSYKLARAYSNILITYVENNPLALGEALAFNQTIGYLGAGPLSDVTKTYLDFYIKNRESYEDVEDASNVAVFRSYASLAYNNAEVQLCTILVEQTLIQTSLSFDLIFDDDLHNLAKYKVVILPNMECLSEDQVNLLKTFVRSGGSLVVIGQTGFYDEWRRVRVVPALHDMVDYAVNITESLDGEGKSADADTQSSKKQVGPGLVAYLSSVEFDGSLPPFRPNFSILNEYWKLPKNWEALSSLVRWAAHENVPLAIRGPAGVVAHSTIQRSLRRTFVHVLNYNATEVPIQHDIQVHVLLPEGSKRLKATIRRPEQDEEIELSIRHEPSGISANIPELHYYALFTIYW